MLNDSISKDNVLSYSEPIGKGNRCVSEYLKKKQLSLAQTIIQTISNSINSNQTSNRGLIAWHSTGSGKTLTAMSIIDSFWNSKKNIVFISSIESLQSNPPATFYENARTHFGRFQNKSIDEIEKAFKGRNIKFMSFAKLAHFLLISKPSSS
jgi:superfamily II DNA or RNA helicase